MSLERKFEEAVLGHFSTITMILDRELCHVASSSYPAATNFLLFEYDSPHFSEDFTVSVWPMSGRGEVTGEGRWLLKGEVVAVPSTVYDDPVYEEIDPWAVASELFEKWLVSRWVYARKSCSSLPAFIGHHDSYFKTDLITGAQVNWDEVLRANA